MIKFIKEILLVPLIIGAIGCESNRFDVVFQAAKSSDPSPRKYGLDSLVLALDDGVWKISSFIVHYESKL